MSRGAFFLFLFCATYLRADLLISFYSCDSGIVDCSSFPAHYYGDFGLSGHPPINVYMPSDAYQVTVTESNIHGQVIGYISSVYLPGNGAIFGANGAAVMLPDQGDEFNAPVDINNNGVFLFNVLNGGRLSEAYISFGSAGMQPLRNYLDEPALLGQLGAQDLGAPEGIGCCGGPVIRALGINDQNQILVDLPVERNDVWSIERGVLSPTVVPEPTGVAPLLTVAAIGALTIRRKFYARQS